MCKSKVRRHPRVNHVEDDQAKSEDAYTIGMITHGNRALNTERPIIVRCKTPKQRFATFTVNNTMNVITTLSATS